MLARVEGVADRRPGIAPVFGLVDVVGGEVDHALVDRVHDEGRIEQPVVAPVQPVHIALAAGAEPLVGAALAAVLVAREEVRRVMAVDDVGLERVHRRVAGVALRRAVPRLAAVCGVGVGVVLQAADDVVRVGGMQANANEQQGVHAHAEFLPDRSLGAGVGGVGHAAVAAHPQRIGIIRIERQAVRVGVQEVLRVNGGRHVRPRLAAVGAAPEDGDPVEGVLLGAERPAEVHEVRIGRVNLDDVVVGALRAGAFARAVVARLRQPLPRVAPVGAADGPRPETVNVAAVLVLALPVNAAARQQDTRIALARRNLQPVEIGEGRVVAHVLDFDVVLGGPLVNRRSEVERFPARAAVLAAQEVRAVALHVAQ